MFDIFGPKDPQKALQRAHELIREGRVDSAIKVLEDNLTETEESFDLYLELAGLYFDTEQRGRSVELLRRIQSLVPSRTDEIVELLSSLFYRHTSIDVGDFLLQLLVTKEEYGEVEKILRAFNEREIKLLLTRYEKMRQLISGKRVITKKDFENLLLHSSINFFLQESKIAIETIEPIIGTEGFGSQILGWARTIARERFNDPYASLLLLKIQVATRNFGEAINQAQRIYEKFPDFVDPLIEIITQITPPKDLEENYTRLTTELYIKKRDLEASIKRLQQLLKKDPGKADDVIKALRELEKIDPKNLKILYSLSDTYSIANRITLAINELNKILEIDPNQYQEVLQRYNKAFEKELNNPIIIQGLVNLYLKQNDLKGATDVIKRAYVADHGLQEEYILNLNTILENDINNPEALYLLGLNYAHRGDKDNALVIFDTLTSVGEYNYIDKATAEILKTHPDDLTYLNLRARNLVMLGKVKEALSLVSPHLGKGLDEILVILPTLDLTINKSPDLAKKIIPFYEQYKKDEPFVFALAMARAHAFCGDYERSLKNFEQCFANLEKKEVTKRALIEVIKERPNAVSLLLMAARIFMKEGNVEIATQFFKTAQMVDPNAFFEIVNEFYDTLKTFPKDREVRVLLIDTFFNRKLYDRVIEEAKKGIEVFGSTSQYFNLKLGQALVESGNLTDSVRPLMLSLEGEEDYSAEVIKYLDKILEIDKSNVPAHFARGRALAKARRIEEAVDEYLLTARILPARTEYVYDELKSLSSKIIANPKLIFALGSMEINLKKYDDAIKHLLQASELNSILAKQVVPVFEKLLSEKPSPLLEFSLARVYHLMNLKSSAVKLYIGAQTHDGNFREQAISELKKICAEESKDIESRRGLAQIYYNYNNLEDALALTKEIYKLDSKESNWAKTFIAQILAKNPKHIPSYYLFSNIFLNEGDYVKAIDVLKRLIDIAPSEKYRAIEMLIDYKEKSPNIMFYLGILYEDIGELRNAIKLFEKLFTLNVSYGESIKAQIKEILTKDINLGGAYLLACNIYSYEKNYAKAIDALKQAQKFIPEMKEELALKEGQLYFEMDRPKEAIEIYSRLLNETKDRKRVYRMIKKFHDEYLKEKLLIVKGDDEESLLTRANIYLLMDKVAEAEKELKFVPKSRPSVKRLAILKARIYLKKNRPMDAMEIMKDLPVDYDTAPVYADIYEAMGSYSTAAAVLRQSGIDGVEERIRKYDKLAQEKRLTKGRYFIEGRI